MQSGRYGRSGAIWTAGLACSLLAGTGLFFLQGVGNPPPAMSDLSHGPADFGEVLESSRHQHVLPLRNNTTKGMTVRLSPSCDCAGVAPNTLELRPGEAKDVTVTLDLLHGRSRFQGMAVRPYVAHLRAAWGDTGSEQATVQLSGRVKAVLEAWPPHLHLSREISDEEGGTEEAVRLTPAVPLNWLVVKTLPPGLEARIEPAEKGHSLKVRAKAGLPHGPFRAEVVLSLEGKEGTSLPDQAVVVTGTVVGRYGVFPAENVFGIRPVGGEAVETVRVFGRKGEAFTVAAVKAGGGTTVQRRAGAGETLYEVRQRFVAAGENMASVTFELLDARGGRHSVTHVISYYGSTAGR